jgi:hypothetical protein
LPSSAEIDSLLALVDTARGSSSYQTGLAAALQAILLSPHFVYRVERDAAHPDSARPVTADELATRLSYFSWSSMPDDALFGAAESGQLLNDPSELPRQVARLLADTKAETLVEDFGATWLKLSRLANPLGVDMGLFPSYDDALRTSASRETRLFFDSLLRDNAPLGALLTADYGFVDQRLATHYALTPLSSGVQRVSLLGSERRGILTQASVLLGTSLPSRTSPVKRGVWILEQLLCTTPPPPPADVMIPPLSSPAPNATLRQTLEQHRKNPTCAGCHGVMDPLGFGLEHFDAIGHYRELDNGVAVDASGTYADGRAFVGARELGDLLATDPRFASCVTKRLLSYAAGRSFMTGDGARYAEAFTSRAVAGGAGRWLSLIAAIAQSEAFLTRTGDAP